MCTRLRLACDNLLAHVAESTPVALIVIDENRRVQWCNSEAVALLGYSASELTSSDFASLVDIKAEAPHGVVPSEPTIAFDAGASTLRNVGTAKSKDQRLVPVKLVSLPFEHNGRTMTLLAIHDVTEGQYLERENAALHRQLSALNGLESAQFLTSSILHDFNNILQAILGNVGRAIESTVDTENRKALEAVIQATQRGSTLVRRLRGTSQHGFIGEGPQESPVPFVGIVHEALGLLRGALPAEIRLEWSLNPATPTVSASEIDLHQVVMNLGINAAEAMQAQGGLLRVTLEPEIGALAGTGMLPDVCHKQYAKLCVRDSGLGMDELTLKRAFEPFFSTKPKGRSSGLGLAVVRRIVERLGGDISVQTELGSGTAFCVRLPASTG